MSTRPLCPPTLLLLALSSISFAQQGSNAEYSLNEAQSLLKQYCVSCHQGKSAAAGFDVVRAGTMKGLQEDPRKWTRMVNRIRNAEMPPRGAPAPNIDQRDQFVSWVENTLKTAACADGISPGPSPIRRLNRNEYGATVRDLLNIQINAGHALPAEGAGGEGFDNAAETLFLSPIHAEKYLEAAKRALEYGAKDPRSRVKFLIAEPNEQTTPEQAARKILEAFLPRAFRRPVQPREVGRFLALFRKAETRGEPFRDSILYALQGTLVSPHFLFRMVETNPNPEPRLLDDYALATRLSYFLWGTMPDDVLLDLAGKGTLRDPAALDEQIARMLKDIKTREFAEHFVEQWLGTRELGRDIKPDPKLFAIYYDAEIQSAIRYEPILFFQEILTGNLSLLNLLDSKFTILTNKLARHYGIKAEGLRQQPKRIELPENSHRGGLLGMAAVLAVSSYPQRTSPVLRGKWLLEAIFGTPPPPPPPNVPELEVAHEGASPKTMRELLSQHRQNPACASCHNRIDPLGFALENYTVLGLWRTEDAGKPVDAKGELPDGAVFEGPDQLKALLLDRKSVFLRNLTTKLLGYALGRGLALEDYCTVDHIVKQVEKDGYSSHALIREIVRSVPFRYQAGTALNMPVREYDQIDNTRVSDER